MITPSPGRLLRYTSTCDQSPVSHASAATLGTSRNISAPCSADPNRSAGASTCTAFPSSRLTTPSSHRSRLSKSASEASAAATIRSAGTPEIMCKSASVDW